MPPPPIFNVSMVSIFSQNTPPLPKIDDVILECSLIMKVKTFTDNCDTFTINHIYL